MRLVEALHPHRRGLLVLLGLLLALGGYAGVRSARSIYPRVAFPRIVVIAERGEQPVRGMLVGVTRPIEQAVSTVPDLMRVRSKTVRGASELSLDFRADADMREVLALVRARTAESGIPADTQLTIERQTPAVFPVLSFNVIPGKGDAPDPVARARLAEWVQQIVAPRLARLPDAFRVTVQSGDRREFVFSADPVKLLAANVALHDVVKALEESNRVAAVGRSSAEGLQYQLLVDGEITQSDQIAEVCVARGTEPPARLGDLGAVSEESAERTMIVTGGGQDGIVVSVFLRDGGKVTDLSEDVGKIVADTTDSVPGSGSIVRVYDQAELVNDSIAGVRDAIGLGALLSVVVMAVFLGNWRLTLITALSIPISVALTIATFPLIGESLNLMSLGGLAVAIGLVIDDAIVVSENVARRLAALGTAPGRPALFGAVADGTREVVGAIVGSSLTTVVVFLPLVLLDGVVGQFFRSLSLALGLSIIASMLVSLVYAPLLLLLPGLMPRQGTPPRRFTTWLQNHYAASLTRLFAHPWVTAVVVIALLIVGAAQLTSIGTGLLPDMDEGGFVLDYTLPVGSSLAQTDAVCRRVEAILVSTPEVASLSRRTGAELGFFATEQFTGDMLVGLKSRTLRKRTIFQILEELRDRLKNEVPQGDFEFIQVMKDTIGDLSGNPKPIEIKIFGTEYKDIQKVAGDVARALEGLKESAGIVDVKSGSSFGSPELSWKPDRRRLARAGLTTEDFANELTTRLLGTVATRVREGERFVDLRVRMKDPALDTGVTDGTGPDLRVGVAAGEGRVIGVPVGTLASFERHVNENELGRENQTPMVAVEAAVEGHDLGSAGEAVRRAMDGLAHPASVRIEVGGEIAGQAEAFRNLVRVFAIGAGLVFLLLVVQFRSLRLPVVMFLALPFGQVGALLALRIAHVPLNVSSGMGLIMLVGLVVKNGIIMIESAQQLRREGRSELDAIREAARTRLRPVLMTTLAAIAGLIPLALGVGAGSELQLPLAIAVIGGLAVSTVFTLIVVPLGCAVFARGQLVPDLAMEDVPHAA